MYDVVNNYTPDFKSFCENKTVVNVYEYKVDKTYKLTLVYNGRTENRICKVADNISLSEVNKYGYNFEGWSENPNDDFFTIKSIYAGKYTDDVTLYAIFKPISFYIYYSTMPTNSEYCNESKRVTYDEILTIEKLNVFGDLEIILEDENARIEYYFNGEIVNRNDFELNSIGTYTIKIISSDNTATRSINIIVKDYENLMFEVFYENERLYLEYSNNGTLGNMKMKYDPLIGPYFIGYFGEQDLSNLTQVAISGNTAYEDMLYYSDKETPITNLDNLVLDIMTDLDGSITEIIGGKYVVVYAKIENAYYAVYFVFENRPPYPMTFSFDTDNNDIINENDKHISLKVDLEEVETGVVDLGDFIIGESGPSVEVTREELGMAEVETSVEVIVNWASTFEDYSYQYFTSLPEGQDMPELIGPSEDNMTSTLVLNFEDDGSGKYLATIYVCSEGATLETLMEFIFPVTFILVN